MSCGACAVSRAIIRLSGLPFLLLQQMHDAVLKGSGAGPVALAHSIGFCGSRSCRTAGIYFGFVPSDSTRNTSSTLSNTQGVLRRAATVQGIRSNQVFSEATGCPKTSARFLIRISGLCAGIDVFRLAHSFHVACKHGFERVFCVNTAVWNAAVHVAGKCGRDALPTRCDMRTRAGASVRLRGSSASIGQKTSVACEKAWFLTACFVFQHGDNVAHASC